MRKMIRRDFLRENRLPDRALGWRERENCPLSLFLSLSRIKPARISERDFSLPPLFRASSVARINKASFNLDPMRYLSPSLRLAADPADPAGGNPAEPPASPKVVAKTPIKTPRELSLEKELAKVQDDVAALRDWQKEVNGFMGDAFPQGKPVKVPIKKADPALPPTPATPAKPRHELDTLLFGQA